MAPNRREEPEEVRIPDEVLFGPEVDEDHYNSCYEDDDERLLVTGYGYVGGVYSKMRI